jgi:hypothetical protein
LECSTKNLALDAGIFRHCDQASWTDRVTVERISTLVSKGGASIWSDEVWFDVAPVVGAFNRFPDLRPLLVCIVAGLFTEPPADLSTIELDLSATSALENDISCVASAVATLRILFKNDFTEFNIRSLVTSSDACGTDFVRLVCDCHYLSQDKKEKLCSNIIQIYLRADREDAAPFRLILKRLLDARKSGIATREMWIDKLSFPPDAFLLLSEKTAV